MAKRKRKEKHEEHMDESWLIPYADLLTLLLALFIVLFAMSSIDANKFQMLARAFNSTFEGGTGIMEYPSPLPDGEMEELDVTKTEPKEQQDQEHEKLKEAEKKINDYISKKGLNDKLKTSLTDEGLLITINNDILFESGSVYVRKRDEDLAKEISQLLVMEPPRSIIVSGHTDNIPIQNAQYDSNWELSVMRAVEFMKLLLTNPSLSPELFSAKGYGEFKPISSNKTTEGRQKNRRVEILILPLVQKGQQNPVSS
ncbi:flagellar motor protein MotB [Bacillus sp. FJAT-42376]|uniref:flagellar motor protein MotB n=1 Tax=Bacillus sp. FJAT-42376 TaxID=2014076 RepID=UPI000F4F8940|nr:flagellar motor protein MotB [Bacillus sp. FJAT-42376]AZB42540.1 flagellar motor protein MotB [Bacillus sp. FJAT-42376]